MSVLTGNQLDVRRELMIAKLADWTETVDPCGHGHVDHGPEAHIGRRIVHTVSPNGFGADWDYDDAVAFIRSATDVGAAIETDLPRAGHIGARGVDGGVIAFECKAGRP